MRRRVPGAEDDGAEAPSHDADGTDGPSVDVKDRG